MTNTRKIGYGIVLALSAALLVLGAFFDKNVADILYQPDNIGARIMESVGIFPPFIFLGSLFVVLFYLIKDEDKKATLKRVLTTVGASLVYLVFGYMATDELLEGALSRLLIALGASCMLTPLTFLVFRKRARETLKRLVIFLIFASIVSVISSLITINVLKYFWGRARYREMMSEGDYLLEGFTAWYHPNGFTLHGHHSFPSGHTCSATNLLVLCALPEVFPEAENGKKTVAIVAGIYIFSMAYSRMVLGAHFLSDVTGGFLIGFLTYLIARYLYFDKSSIVAKAILEINRGEEIPPANEPLSEGEEGILPQPESPEESSADQDA
ncbi:MAG: phosphatase PAP2 family protein [Clostridia bacterium]|nr:phosphatase PAP2 family protein [Clostridia bacterium]